MNTVIFVIAIIDNNFREMLKYVYEKGKLVERSGRKATSLSLPLKGRYGSRVAMEKNISMRILLAGNIIKSGGYYEASRN
jgi:hypothetical protein